MDKAHKWTDKQLESLEKKIGKVYAQASKELEKKQEKYFKQFEKLDKQKKKLVKKGKMTQEGYEKWFAAKVTVGEHWTAMKNLAVNQMIEADKTAVAYINDKIPEVYATNYNYLAAKMSNESALRGTASFELASADTIKKLVMDGKTILPYKEVDGKKAERWHTKTVNSQVLQGLLQGESAQQISKRLYKKVGMTAKGSAIRNARTTITSAENGGRMGMLQRAKDAGIDAKKVWMSVHDSRVRESHAMLDGEAEEIDKEFGNGLMYPGDPDGEPEEVYNCRCTMVYELKDLKKAKDIDENNEYAGLSMTETYYSLKDESESYATEFYKTLQESGIPSKVWSDYAAGKLDPETKEKIDAVLKKSEVIKEKTETAHKLVEAKKHLSEVEKDLTFLQTNSEVYSNIWKDDVTVADYDAKKGSIQAKKDYFEMKKSQDPDNPKWDDLLNKLEKFEQDGKLYSQVNSEYQSALNSVKSLQNSLSSDGGGSFGKGAYTQERKDNAMWAKNQKDADDVLRPKTGEIWRNATEQEKDAAFDYTMSYSKFNEPLRGIEYGTNKFLGVGKTDLSAGYKNNGEALNAFTDLLEKSSYETDAWFNRGVRFSGMDKFLKIDESILRNGTQEQLENALIGNVVTEYGFMSVGVTKGKGFNGDILLNVYAPAGSKYLYAEPFSNYGNGDGRRWNGLTKQSTFGTEDEAIFQQGTMLRITKVERKNPWSTIYIDVEVVGNEKPQRWQK